MTASQPIPMMMKNSSSALALAHSMTPIERRAGRFMRAPDHDAAAPAPSPSPTPAASDAAAASADADAGAGTIVGDAADATKDDGKPAAESKEGEASAGDKDRQPDGDKPSIIGAPEAYDFKDVKLGDGVTFDKDAFDAVEPVLRDMNLSQDAANKLVGAYAEKIVPLIQQRLQTQATEAGAALKADWARQTQADKEVGGANLDETKAMAARAMSKFLPQGDEGQKFRTFMNESGLGNHPEMVRFMARVGRALGEAKADPAGAGGQQLTREEKFYGKK